MKQAAQKSPEERAIDVLEELLVWTKVGMYAAVESVLKTQFGESTRAEEKLAFELCDGEASQTEIIKVCKTSIADAKISTASMSRWTTKWEKLGLLRKDGNQMTRLFSLRDFGIDVPNSKAVESRAQADSSANSVEPTETR